MAQKSPILLHKEAEQALINTVNYFLQQGVPSSAMQSIFSFMQRDLDKLVEQEMQQAQEEYDRALKEEEKAQQEQIENQEVVEEIKEAE